MKKPKTRSQLVKALDAIFSIYIRIKDADSNGFVKCFTSGKLHHWTKLHCGHFCSRRHMATRWNEQNCKPQSVADNIFNQGSSPQFAINLDKLYGQGTSEKLVMMKSNKSKMQTFELNLLITHYTAEVEKLRQSKGL